jgi:uncharacterized membrane protein YkoI
MLQRASLLGGLGAILALCSCDPSTSSTRLAVMSGVDTAEMITLQDAVAAALEEVPGGFAVEVALEIEDDDEVEPAAYEVVVYVDADQQMIEVEIDAYSGDVLEVEIEEDGDEDEDGEED